RPTGDRVRESLFNVLAHGVEGVAWEGATVVDVFAGTGALGLEALSRGAGHGVFIDNDPGALACVRRNAGPLGLARNVTILRLDARRLPPPPLAAKAPAALAFLDPPYRSGLAPEALTGLTTRGWLVPGALSVVEVAAKEPLEPLRGFETMDERTWGAARLVFLRYG
ncbi:MAG: RsmD family RNA methyltransferase, partial [Rhodospirillales bacterium]